MNKIQGRRCLKLARFLEVEIASKPELFYFGQMMDVGGKEPKEAFEAGGGCGTVGCAIGWSPMAFPRQLKWVTITHGHMEVVVRKTGENEMQSEFFADSRREWFRLFEPKDQWDGSSGLSSTASPESVAENIRKLVKKWTGLESELTE